MQASAVGQYSALIHYGADSSSAGISGTPERARGAAGDRAHVTRSAPLPFYRLTEDDIGRSPKAFKSPAGRRDQGSSKARDPADDRGFFREVIRSGDPFFAAGFGQLSHSLVYPGIVKAWHGHGRQSQWTYVAAGVLMVALHDRRSDSETYRTTQELLLGDHQAARVYLLPPGVVHGYRCRRAPPRSST